MSITEDEKMLKIIEKLEVHIDSKFDSLTALLNEIKLATNENTKDITKLESKHDSLKEDHIELKQREVTQHQQFYDRLLELEKQNERLKTIVAAAGVIMSAIFTILQFIIK